jgi:hypothetical protein
MKTKLTLLAFASLALLSSCTENQRAKKWGGTASVDLPANTKLTGATWKDAELWYLTRPMRADEVAETSTLHEQSSFGLIQGKVVFNESKK